MFGISHGPINCTGFEYDSVGQDLRHLETLKIENVSEFAEGLVGLVDLNDDNDVGLCCLLYVLPCVTMLPQLVVFVYCMLVQMEHIQSWVFAVLGGKFWDTIPSSLGFFGAPVGVEKW